MLIDPKDAEIARLKREIELLRVYQDIVWEPPVGYWQDRAEKAEAERDKVVSEAKGISDHVLAFAKVDTDNPVEAASRMAQHIRELTAERDDALAQVADAYEAAAQAVEWKYNDANTVDGQQELTWAHDDIRALTPTDALAARDRRDAQMRAEGRKEAAEAFHAEIRKGSLALEAEGYAVFADRFIQASALVRASILAAAEKEAGNGIRA